MATNSIYKSSAGEAAVMALYDSMLERWPVPHTERNVCTRHGNTFIIDSGSESADPVVLLHGAGSNSLVWSTDVAVYNRRFRVCAVDLPGEPGKSAAIRPAWGGPAYGEWLQDVLDALNIRQTMLIGFSQGAWTALRFSVSRPERIKKLVLLTPGGIVPDRLSFAVAAIGLSMLGRQGIRRINRRLLADQVISDEGDEAMTLIATNFKPRIGRLPLFTDSELRQLTMPVLLVMGEHDVLRDGRKISARLKRQVPHLEAIDIPGGGHALLDTARRILPFLLHDDQVNT